MAYESENGGPMIVTIPAGMVVIPIAEYKDLIRDNVRIIDREKELDRENEAAYNRGFADGRSAAYEEVAAKKLSAEMTEAEKAESMAKKPDSKPKEEKKQDPKPMSKKGLGNNPVSDAIRTQVQEARLKGKSAKDIAAEFGLDVSTAPASVKGKWLYMHS